MTDNSTARIGQQTQNSTWSQELRRGVNKLGNQNHVQNSYMGSASTIESVVKKKRVAASRKGTSVQTHE